MHLIAQLGRQLDDAARIWREHLDGHVLVEVDTADRGLFDRKFSKRDWLGLYRGNVPVREFQRLDGEEIGVRRTAGGRHLLPLGASRVGSYARGTLEIVDVCCKISTPREARQGDRGNCP